MTIVNRRTFVAGRGKTQEVLDLLREGAEGSTLRYRLYSSYFGKFDEIAMEVEFENLAHMEQAWAETNARLDAIDFWPRWVAATEAGGVNEVWVLETYN
jgi:hypothetical protein